MYLLLLVAACCADAKSSRVLLDVPPIKIHGIIAKHASQGNIVLANIMNEPVIVKEVALSGGSHIFALAESLSVPFTLAPAERAEIPVVLLGKRGSGRAHLRIVASAPTTKHDSIIVMKFHYEIK